MFLVETGEGRTPPETLADNWLVPSWRVSGQRQQSVQTLTFYLDRFLRGQVSSHYLVWMIQS